MHAPPSLPPHTNLRPFEMWLSPGTGPIRCNLNLNLQACENGDKPHQYDVGARGVVSELMAPEKLRGSTKCWYWLAEGELNPSFL